MQRVPLGVEHPLQENPVADDVGKLVIPKGAYLRCGMDQLFGPFGEAMPLMVINPLYNWDVHKKDGYAWWIARIRHQLELTDLVRIDHFR